MSWIFDIRLYNSYIHYILFILLFFKTFNDGAMRSRKEKENCSQYKKWSCMWQEKHVRWGAGFQEIGNFSIHAHRWPAAKSSCNVQTAFRRNIRTCILSIVIQLCVKALIESWLAADTLKEAQTIKRDTYKHLKQNLHEYYLTPYLMYSIGAFSTFVQTSEWALW